MEIDFASVAELVRRRAIKTLPEPDTAPSVTDASQPLGSGCPSVQIRYRMVDPTTCSRSYCLLLPTCWAPAVLFKVDMEPLFMRLIATFPEWERICRPYPVLGRSFPFHPPEPRRNTL